MRPFRAVYGFDGGNVFSDYLWVSVIGYHNRFNSPVDSPGMGDYFIAIFHDPVFLGSPDHSVEAPANTMIIYPPDSLIYHGRPGPWHRTWIRCSGALVAQLVDSQGLPVVTPLVLGDDLSAVDSILGIHREIRHPLGADLRNIEDLFRIWFRNVRRIIEGSTAKPIPEPLRRARQYIESNFLERLSLDEVARYCFISRPHLSNSFSKYFGIPPLAFAIYLRMEHAKDLLRETSLTVTQVAAESGFEDVYYFSKLFRQKTGICASDYRRANRGERKK